MNDRLNKRCRELGYTDYDSYLKSVHWKSFRLKYKASTRKQACERCDYHLFQLHHLVYDRLGNENLEDVVALCSNCHILEHKLPNDKRIKFGQLDYITKYSERPKFRKPGKIRKPKEVRNKVCKGRKTGTCKCLPCRRSRQAKKNN
jgi:hypothetical protein